MKNAILLSFVILFVFANCKKENATPSVQSVNQTPNEVMIGETAQLNCMAVDADGDLLNYSWSCNGGAFIGATTGNSVSWKAPDKEGQYVLKVTVSDGKSVAEKDITIVVKIPPGEVTGFVYFSGTTIPVSGVNVRIGALQSTTSSDGKFSIKANFGNQQVQATKDGFDSFTKNITISELTNQVIIELTTGTYTSKVSGYVKTESGIPISGIPVVLLNPDGKDSNLKTTTDASGYYQLPSVPQGTRTIHFKQVSHYGEKKEILFIANTDYPFSVVLFDYTIKNSQFVYEGRTYKTVIIGGKEWMAENLAYLPNVSPPTAGSATEPYYYVYGYSGTDVATAKQRDNYTVYGVLYNWPAAKAACPSGWHLPTDSEWTDLENYLIANGYNYDGTTTGNKIAKSLAATTNWDSYSVVGTIGNNLSLNNKCGFSALPGGYLCNNCDTKFFYDIGYLGKWWSSTESGTNRVGAWGVNSGYSGIFYLNDFKDYALSVRCVKD